jgi:Tfp pilus assembly protein PilO
MRSSTTRILSILLSAMFLIGLVFVITSLVKPEFDRVLNKRAEIYSKNQSFRSRAEAVEKVSNLIKDVKSFNNLRSTVSLAIPLNMSVPEILNQIDAIARTSNVSINSFETSPEAFISSDNSLTKRLGVLKINLSVNGEYDNLKDFIRFLETNVRIFNIQSYEFLAKKIEQINKMTYNLNVSFHTYYQED